MKKYAVYGTLRMEFNHFLMKNAKLLSEEWTKPEYTMYFIGYPGIVPGKDKIFIEVYDVPEELEHQLDMYEGYDPNDKSGSLYLKKEIETTVGTAFIYIYNDKVKGLERIKSGDYVNYVKNEIR